MCNSVTSRGSEYMPSSTKHARFHLEGGGGNPGN